MSTTELDRFVLAQMPHFIAGNYQRLLAAVTPEEQVRRALHIYNLGLRATTIGLVSQYLTRDRDKVRDDYLNRLLLEKFSRLTLDAWQQLFFTTLRVYEGNRDLFFIPELYDFYWDTSAISHRPRPDTEKPFTRLTQIYLEIEKANMVPRDEAGWSSLAEETLDLLRRYLRAMSFIGDYHLIRILEIQSQRYRFALHRGVEITIDEAPLPEHVSLSCGRFYLRKGEEDFLHLHPLLIFWEGETGADEVFPTDVGVYDRFVQQRLRYLLSALARTISADQHIAKFLHLIFDTIEDVKLSREGAEKLTWLHLCDLCQDISEHRMATVRGKYDPALYLRREKTYQAFASFLRSPDKKCFVLIGKSGVGKSNFILAAGDELRQASRDRVTVLMYDGAHLKATPSLTTFIAQDFNTRLRLPGGQIDNIWAEIDQIEGIEDRQLILYVDAINESSEARELLKQLDELIQQPWPWMKVVISSRPETWQNVRRGLILSEKFYYRERSAQYVGVELEPFSYSEEMSSFSRAELPAVYAKYRDTFDLQTEYEELRSDLRAMLRDPLSLLLVAKTCQASPIPEDLDRFSLMEQYVDALCDSRRLDRLRAEDLRFLARELIPLMTKDGSYRNQITLDDLDAAGGGLHERIFSDQILSNGRRLNQSFVNLVDAEILTHKHTGREQSISFKYERFYDYFVGKHLFEICGQQENTRSFFGALVSELESALFLWGALRQVLIELLTTAQAYALIGELGSTDNELQAELLVSVLSEYYPHHQTGLHPVLSTWLEVRGRDALASGIAAKIAIACLVEDLLERLLVHPNENMRCLVVQAIHELWKTDPELTTRILGVLPAEVSPWHLSRSRRSLRTLLYASMLLIFRDYYDIGATTQTVAVVRNLWQPIVTRLFLVSRIPLLERSMRRLRLILFRVGSKIIVNVFKNVEREGFTYSFRDVITFFPATEYQKEMMERLLPHLDAAAGRAPEPVDALMRIIEELAAAEEDTSFLYNAAQAGIVSHFNASPLPTAAALGKLLENLEQLYPPTKDPQAPTAAMWYNLGVNTFVGIPWQNVNPETARAVFGVLADTSRAHTFRYRDRFRCRCGKTLLIGTLDNLILGYHFDVPEVGADLLKKIVRFYLDQGDHRALRVAGISYLAMSMVRQRMPEAGVAALHDFIRTIVETDYLERLDKKKEAQFWRQAADSLIERANVYREYLWDLLERFEPGELPEAFTVRIRNASPQDNLGYHTGEAWMAALHRGFQDEDPAFRNMVKWFLRTAMEVKNMERLAERFIVFLLDVLYPGASLLSGRAHDPGTGP